MGFDHSSTEGFALEVDETCVICWNKSETWIVSFIFVYFYGFFLP